jgi:sulfur carrier protein
MRVRLRNPDRELDVAGDRRVRELLVELGMSPDTVLVIRGKELLTRDERVSDEDTLEIRPVISGGAS